LVKRFWAIDPVACVEAFAVGFGPERLAFSRSARLPMTIYPWHRGRAPALALWPEFISVGIFCWLVLRGDLSLSRAGIDWWSCWALVIWLVPAVVLEPPARILPPTGKVLWLAGSIGLLILAGITGESAFYPLALGAALVSIFSAPASPLWISGLVCWLPLAAPLWQLSGWQDWSSGTVRVALAALVTCWALRKCELRLAKPARIRPVR
jgi:hypothetical protein